MSISTGPQKIEEFKREKFFKKSSIQRIVEGIKGKTTNILDTILLIAISLTAIGELFGRNYGLKWYILVGIILIAVIADYFIHNLYPVENVMIKEEDKEDSKINK